MDYATKTATIAVEDPSTLDTLPAYLAEQGFQLKGPEELAPWFESRSLPFQAEPLSQILGTVAETLPINDEACHIFVLPPSNNESLLMRAQKQALLSYLLTLQNDALMIVTHPSQYTRLKQPHLLEDRLQWEALCRQFRQNIAPGTLLTLQKSYCPGQAEEADALYSINPAWSESLRVMEGAEGATLTQGQLKNALTGTQLLIQLARTQGIKPVQSLLMQHGWPVHVACVNEHIAEALEHVLFQDSSLTPGGTLIVSHPLPVDTLRRVAQTGIQVVVSPQWEDAGLTEARPALTPVLFEMSRLQLSDTSLVPVSANSLLIQSRSIDARQIAWQTPQKPTDSQLLDLETGVALAEILPECSAVLIREQRSLAIACGMAMPMAAVDFCLAQTAGDTEGAVCVLSGEVYADHVFNALVQARVAGVLFLNTAQFPAPLVNSLRKLPFFAGTYAEFGLSKALEQMGVRYG